MWLIINNIRINVPIGIYKWEKVIKRLVIIQIKIKVKNIVDYDNLVFAIKEFTRSKEFNYIEDLNKGIASHLMKNFNIDELSLTTSKPNIIKTMHYAEVSEYFQA
jgi:dihydroneopterin aldolase